MVRVFFTSRVMLNGNPIGITSEFEGEAVASAGVAHPPGCAAGPALLLSPSNSIHPTLAVCRSSVNMMTGRKRRPVVAFKIALQPLSGLAAQCEPESLLGP